jgi:predicted HAD superfamily hydrolase
MKTYKFTVTLEEWMIEGDEFWEEALDKEPTGVITLHEALKEAIDSQFQIKYNHDDVDMDSVVQLKEYQDKNGKL